MREATLQRLVDFSHNTRFWAFGEWMRKLLTPHAWRTVYLDQDYRYEENVATLERRVSSLRRLADNADFPLAVWLRESDDGEPDEHLHRMLPANEDDVYYEHAAEAERPFASPISNMTSSTKTARAIGRIRTLSPAEAAELCKAAAERATTPPPNIH